MTWYALCCIGESYNFVNLLQEVVRDLVVACGCKPRLNWVFSCLCKSLDIKGITILIVSKAVPYVHA